MFQKIFSQKVKTDEVKIERLLTRGVERIYPDTDFLRKALKEGKRLSIYLGIDPTGPTLHLGHAITLMKLREFQDLGHQIILLIGDFTGMIGDPTDKTATRKKLTRNEVLKNAKLYKRQASKLLSFSGSNKALIRHNSEWLSRMHFDEVLELASNVTGDQLMKRDMFVRRSEEGKSTYLHELLYPLLQGYDSVALDIDGEIGGNDQTFNMLVGRDLMKKLKKKEKFVLTMKLLTDTSGTKMGKTEGNMVSLDQDQDEMFGRIMSWGDDLIVRGFELCTNIIDSEIVAIKDGLEKGANPKDYKIKLARTIVSMYHGEAGAKKAEDNFAKTFSAGLVPENLLEVTLPTGAGLLEIALREGTVSSKSEWRRLIAEGAVSDAISGQKISDPLYKITASATFKIGKRRFLKVIVRP